MARPIDPARHEARRLQIIDAALTRFAADGYHGASTAAICRTAGIGSGTFFHYFPAKADVLIATLELGTGEVRDFFAAQDDTADPALVLRGYVEHALRDLRDERAAGFMRAVGTVTGDERVAKALAAHHETVRTSLRLWAARAIEAGACRADLSAERIASWLMVMVEGFSVGVADFAGFDVRREQAVLVEVVDHFLVG